MEIKDRKRMQLLAAVLVVIGVVLIVIAVAMCSHSDGTKAEEKCFDKNITVAVTPTMDCLPLFVAQECGISDSLNYGLILQMHTARADCDTAIIGGSADAMLTDYVRAEAVNQKLKHPLLLLPHDNLTLYVFTSSKARIKEAKQLTDKMIALDRKSAENIIGQHILDSVKLGDDKTFLVNMLNLNTRAKMINSNIMDAVVLPEPVASVVRKAGNKEIYSTSKVNGRPIGCMLTKKSASTLLRKTYAIACDSIAKYGIHHYDSIFIKRYALHPNVVNSITNRYRLSPIK